MLDQENEGCHVYRKWKHYVYLFKVKINLEIGFAVHWGIITVAYSDALGASDQTKAMYSA